MNRSRTAATALKTKPIAVFAAYIAWIIVPIVLAEAVSAILRAVTAN